MSAIGKREAPQGPVDHTGERVPDWVDVMFAEWRARGGIGIFETHHWRRHQSQNIAEITAYSRFSHSGQILVCTPTGCLLYQNEMQAEDAGLRPLSRFISSLQESADRVKRAVCELSIAKIAAEQLGLRVEVDPNFEDVRVTQPEKVF